MKTTEKAFDGLVVLEYQTGNKNSFPLLVKRHHLRLCKHSYRYTMDIEASKDIVQDSWKTIINKLHTLKDPNSFGSWATKIVTRKSLDYLNNVKRNRKRAENYYEETKVDDVEDNRGSDVQKLLLAIKELPENQQMVLKLFYVEEYSMKEIGNFLGISVGTTKSRLFHAREKLKTILKININEKRH
ncbi:RNA polymerase sigma factor [Flagellimonas sp.]|uniref:RNA polymerase sigma factor n=1 Tax=Flagellimonas sp. TaxID=2058762 RepID=UPI003B58BDCB